MDKKVFHLMIQIQSNQEEYAIEFISCNCRDKIDFLIFFSCCVFFFLPVFATVTDYERRLEIEFVI